jgi:hypothetical protein
MAWKPDFETDVERVRANLLLQGDKGYTVKELFAALKAANLEFFSMVKWRQWEIMDLFQDPNDLPSFLAMSLPDISVEERLHLFELLQPLNRLLDFWCTHPTESTNFSSASEWSLAEWQHSQVQLHPQLKIPVVKEKLMERITERQSFDISQFIPEPAKTPVMVDSQIATCLLPLWEGSQPFMSLVKRWQAVKPVDPITLEPVSEQTAMEEVKQFLSNLEIYLYVLVEPRQ